MTCPCLSNLIHVFVVLNYSTDFKRKLARKLKVGSTIRIAMSAVQRVVGVDFDGRVSPQISSHVCSGLQFRRSITYK